MLNELAVCGLTCVHAKHNNNNNNNCNSRKLEKMRLVAVSQIVLCKGVCVCVCVYSYKVLYFCVYVYMCVSMCAHISFVHICYANGQKRILDSLIANICYQSHLRICHPLTPHVTFTYNKFFSLFLQHFFFLQFFHRTFRDIFTHEKGKKVFCSSTLALTYNALLLLQCCRLTELKTPLDSR